MRLPCSSATAYSPLEHAAWHGWTPTDFVFPFFLFIVGVSITLSFARRAQGNHNRRKLLLSVNAITVYVLSGLSERVMTVIKFADVTGKQVTLKSFLYESVFTPLASPLNASLAYAICYVLVWLGLMWILYRKQIFIKV
ncbi:MAG: DUF5009 domain-containing protein [Pyrinomonadaceae bacterium MAG19_C2-C3]|nr:DUF5009 domain-containing protein [Pyrinomonadaceae bacterium MAG19_C2-C3]